METYTDCKPFVDNPGFRQDRRQMLDSLEIDGIDPPLVSLVQKINSLPHVFSLQCCHGHFLSKDGTEIRTLEALEADTRVEYRLAYIALCIENSSSGRRLQQILQNVPSSIDRDTVQFCSAHWFWDQWPNSYAIQVMPDRFKARDYARITYAEAREITPIRDACFAYLDDCITNIVNQE